MRVFSAIVMLACVTAPQLSAESLFGRLTSASSLKCAFPTGTSTTRVDGRPVTQNDKSGLVDPVHFDSIDPEAGTARIIGGQAARDAVVFVTLAGLTFLETTGSGSVIVTTVFLSQPPGRDEFEATMSRHVFVILGGRSIVGQYHGTCRILD